MQLPWRSLPPPPFVQAVRAPRRLSATAGLLMLLLLGAVAQWTLRRPGNPADPLLAGGALTLKGLAAGHWWTPLTQLFLSTGPAWLWPVALSTLALAGRPLEAVTGRRHLWQLFLLTGLLGGLGQAGFDGLMHREGSPVAGPTPAALGLLLALACLAPKAPLLPWTQSGPFRRVKVLHGALGALAGTALAGTHAPAAGALVGGLTGCLYVHALGFTRRHVALETARAAPRPVSASSSASWSTARDGRDVPVPSPTMRTVPATTLRKTLVVPRFTERELRMTASEFIAEKVDPILEKISRDGLGSLSVEERQLLERAREKMGQTR